MTDLTGAFLGDADLSGAKLEGACLRGASLVRVKLVEAILSNANLSEAVLLGSDLSGAFLEACDAGRVIAAEARFCGAVLSGLKARLSDFSDCDFTGATVVAASFERATLRRARLVGGHFDETFLEFVDLASATLVDSSFLGTCFVGAAFGDAIVMRCDFSRADFNWSNAHLLTMTHCQSPGARWPEQSRVVVGPSVSQPLNVTPYPLHRQASTPEERAEIIRSGLDGKTLHSSTPEPSGRATRR